ncbi:MAG: hypothetical protein GFH27_549301n183 [Chloroflexi bacterium AL-W]|nr:hypothetical protein [Chloroflexi bacterium AL-N1]NOK68376.1 hypothetical protein [Chloroflexi bacterium AL-N10]NOK74022.1 hypothetical protein [Chloroflexi bacterium AL-N5]NOK82990.1 hypothetical protein [Chloroflexi bacterium AL-W]NOK90512.1 hypothetical protein [Chloroflexi bacterium AL-N15]
MPGIARWWSVYLLVRRSVDFNNGLIHSGLTSLQLYYELEQDW